MLITLETFYTTSFFFLENSEKIKMFKENKYFHNLRDNFLLYYNLQDS